MTAGKKSLQSSLGKLAVKNDHDLLSANTICKRMSPYLSERLVYIGQLDSYESGAEIASMLLGIQTNDTAIYRLTDRAGQALMEDEEIIEEPRLFDDDQEVVYAQMDGSMVLTREESWKEVKLGRIFRQDDVYEETEHRNWLKYSEYIAHLGTHRDFECMMSKQLDTYDKLGSNLVFVCDGAKWQWNWVSAEYPQATQILDFYHVMEYIGNYLKLVLPKNELEQEMENVGTQLKSGGVDDLLEVLKKHSARTKTQRQEWDKLITYVENNRSRMEYPDYLKRGLLIGSGAIESAHRTVIQRRMKLAGQRWSMDGARRMLKIRTLNMSDKWKVIKSKIIQAA